MSKTRFFLSYEFIDGKDIIVTDRTICHKAKNVLRLTSNDKIYLFNGAGLECEARIAGITRKQFSLTEVKVSNIVSRPTPDITLAFPVTLESKIDIILQKTTELGVSRYLPFTSQYSRRIGNIQSKVTRWRKIIIEAARQSGRRWLPDVASCVRFDALLARQEGLKIVGDIDGCSPRKIKIKDETVLLAVGPEGGFSDDEHTKLYANEFIGMKLSNNILRVETAAVIGVGTVMLMV